LEKFDDIIANTADLSWVIISGTKAAGFSGAVIPAMTQRAKEKGLKIILDIKGKGTWRKNISAALYLPTAAGKLSRRTLTFRQGIIFLKSKSVL